MKWHNPTVSAFIFMILACGSVLEAQEPPAAIDGLWKHGEKTMSISQVGSFISCGAVSGGLAWDKALGMMTKSGDVIKLTLTRHSTDGFSKTVEGVVKTSGDSNAKTVSLVFASEKEVWSKATGSKSGRTLRVFCEAGYVATFKAKWIERSGDKYDTKHWSSGRLSAGRRCQTTIPITAKNVELWAIRHSFTNDEIFRVKDPDLGKEYKVYGTIFKSAWTTQ